VLRRLDTEHDRDGSAAEAGTMATGSARPPSPASGSTHSATTVTTATTVSTASRGSTVSLSGSGGDGGGGSALSVASSDGAGGHGGVRVTQSGGGWSGLSGAVFRVGLGGGATATPPPTHIGAGFVDGGYSDDEDDGEEEDGAGLGDGAGGGGGSGAAVKGSACLYYYRKQKDSVPKGVIPLTRTALASVAPFGAAYGNDPAGKSGGRKWVFRLRGTRSHYLQAADGEDMARWIAVLKGL